MNARSRASVDGTGALHRARGRCERFQVKHIVVKPGRRLSLHMHHQRAGHRVVVRSAGLITRGERCPLSGKQSAFIRLGVTHRREDPGETPREIIEVQSGCYPGEDDIVRFDDRYGREEGGHARHGNSDR